MHLEKRNTFIFTLFTTMLPIFTISLTVLILNVFLSCKAYQVHRYKKSPDYQEQSALKKKKLKKKQAIIKTQLKPMITLLIVILGSCSCAVGLLFPLLYIPQDASNFMKTWWGMLLIQILVICWPSFIPLFLACTTSKSVNRRWKY